MEQKKMIEKELVIEFLNKLLDDINELQHHQRELEFTIKKLQQELTDARIIRANLKQTN